MKKNTAHYLVIRWSDIHMYTFNPSNRYDHLTLDKGLWFKCVKFILRSVFVKVTHTLERFIFRLALWDLILDTSVHTSNFSKWISASLFGCTKYLHTSLRCQIFTMNLLILVYIKFDWFFMFLPSSTSFILLDISLSIKRRFATLVDKNLYQVFFF